MKKVLLSGLLAFLCLSSFAQNKEDNTIFTTVEQSPQYPGGYKEFSKFVDSTLILANMPTQKGFKNPETRFFIKFVIEKDGSVSDVIPIKEMDEKFIREFKRVLLLSPKWKPGMQNNKPMRVYMMYPITIDPKRW